VLLLGSLWRRDTIPYSPYHSFFYKGTEKKKVRDILYQISICIRHGA
jgi:hypothetical protein